MDSILRQIVAKIADTPPDFADAVDLRDDLSVDSVRLMEMVFEIEQTFSVKFPEDGYEQVNTFSDLLTVVRSLRH